MTQTTHNRAQTGSVLIISLLLVVGVGVVAAGTVSVLQQNATTVRGDARLIQGTSVADSLRLALLAGRDADAVKDRLQNDTLYSSDLTAITLASDNAMYTGSVAFGDKRYGYRFMLNAGQSPPFADPVDRQEGCRDLGDRILCEWESITVSEPLIFSKDTVFSLDKNTEVAFAGPLVFEGDLTFSRQGNKRSLCFTDAVAIVGDVTFSPFKPDGRNSDETCGEDKAAIFQGDLVISDDAKITPKGQAPDSGTDLTQVQGNEGPFDALSASSSASASWSFVRGQNP